MAASLEKLEGLERKLNVLVPTEKIEDEVKVRLKNLANRAKIDGFRPGKAPMHLINQRYAADVRIDVIRDLLQPTLYDALKTAEVTPVSTPRIEPGQIEAHKDFTYSAIFDVFPQFEIKPLNVESLQLIQSEISDQDVEKTVQKLREQHKTWVDVSRKVMDGDKVIVDFDIYDGEVSIGEQGQARGFELVIGEGHFLPALETALIGAEIGQAGEYTVDFPADWHAPEFAGRTLTFKLTIHQVLEGVLPALDEAFIEKFNIKEGGVDAFKKDIRGHMERALERRVKELNRESIFSAFLKANSFDLPMSLINEEIEHLKHEFFHEVFGHEHHDHEKIPDFPRYLFEEKATRRVHLGLLFAEYVKQENIKADDARIHATINRVAEAYEDPQEILAWYREDPKRMAEVEALVIEEIAAEKLIETVAITYEVMDYESVMNAPQVKETEAAEQNNNDTKETA